MIRTTTINMRGKQHMICVKKKMLPEDRILFPIRVQDGKQIVFFYLPGGRWSYDRCYKLSLAEYSGKSYRIGLSPVFIREKKLKPGDKVDVDYRKDRLIITRSVK